MTWPFDSLPSPLRAHQLKQSSATKLNLFVSFYLGPCVRPRSFGGVSSVSPGQVPCPACGCQLLSVVVLKALRSAKPRHCVDFQGQTGSPQCKGSHPLPPLGKAIPMQCHEGLTQEGYSYKKRKICQNVINQRQTLVSSQSLPSIHSQFDFSCAPRSVQTCELPTHPQ